MKDALEKAERFEIPSKPQLKHKCDEENEDDGTVEEIDDEGAIACDEKNEILEDIKKLHGTVVDEALAQKIHLEVTKLQRDIHVYPQHYHCTAQYKTIKVTCPKKSVFPTYQAANSHHLFQ